MTRPRIAHTTPITATRVVPAHRPLAAALAFLLLAALIALRPAPAAAADDAPLASLAFGAVATPSGDPPRPIGGYSRGCIAGAATLPADGPHFQAMRLSRNRRHGHPSLVAFVEDLATRAPALGLAGLLVGDLGQPRGGPMPQGHASHQSGLDVDIWFTEMPDPPLTPEARETLPFTTMLEPGPLTARTTDPARFTEPFKKLLRQAAEDPRVARIFVAPPIKKTLCDWPDAGTGKARAWLAKIRPWYGHDAHFHVRLACPEGARACRDQAPPPPGDGCGAPLAYWFTDAPYTPDPDAKPAPPLTLARMPPACRALLAAAPVVPRPRPAAAPNAPCDPDEPC